MKRNVSREPTLDSELKSLGAITTPTIRLFDQFPDALFWIKDTQGEFRWVNRAMFLLNGCGSRREMLGKKDPDYSEDSRASQFQHDDAKALAGEPVVGRIELIVFNHIGRWFVTTKLPLCDARGRIVGTAGVAVPMQQKELEGGGASLAAAMHFIGRHFREHLTNGTIAQACGMSVRAFERQFREAYNCSPHAYIRQLRVRLSCQTLVFSKHSLASVAAEYGFSDQSHFTREFRLTMGMTPRTYRMKYQG